MIKKITSCLLVTMLFSTMLMGQSEKNPSQDFPRQEVSIGYGDVLLAISPISEHWRYSYNSDYEWFAPNTYKGDMVSPGVFSLSYMYGVKKWLWFGVSASYASFYQNVYDFSHQKVATNSGHKISVIPMVRFMYVNKEYFNLYSACGIGLSLGVSNYKDINVREFDTYTVINLTAIGVSVGKDLRGFAEFGCGSRGVFNCGIQYRF